MSKGDSLWDGPKVGAAMDGADSLRTLVMDAVQEVAMRRLKPPKLVHPDCDDDMDLKKDDSDVAGRHFVYVCPKCQGEVWLSWWVDEELA
jgi:hypothetical protein